jgi:hypothetical protein
LDNDKSFAAYALVLIAGVASVITATVHAGVTSLPSPLVFLEHVALGLTMRASYKAIGGWNWADWSFTSEAAGRAVADTGYYPTPSGTANAQG